MAASGMKTLNEETVSAGIIIIGDEILKGQVQDTNTKFLTEQLYDLGVKVKRVSVIPDEIDIIAEEIVTFSNRYNYVITSGGIGPTHDDLTFEAVAVAFKDELAVHEDIAKPLKVYFKSETLNEGQLKLATIPKSSKLNLPPASYKGLHYPLVSVQNVFIFPGIPELLRKSFLNIGKYIFDHSTMKKITHEHFLIETEVQFASKLNALVKKYAESGVVFGSYPAWVNNYYKVRLTVEAANEEILDQVDRDVISDLPVLDNFDKTPAVNSMIKIEQFLTSCTDLDFVQRVRDSLSTIEECFNRYEPNKVIIAFNGGKDCIVILHLAFAYLKSKQLLKDDEKLQVLYVKDDEPFPEVTEFMEASRIVYNLDIVNVGRPMKEGLQKMLNDRPNIEAAILGTRNGDPNAASQKKFCPTDADWPKLMRVNPILCWKYNDIWAFIRQLNLPYPGLYDRGYTSLGDRKNTVPNPALAVTEDDGSVSYKPAYTLEDGSLERHGRN